jgi:hypothetical protein
MPPVPFRIPQWADPNNASVLDSPLQKAVRTLGQFMGATDPQAQVMAIATPIELPKPARIGMGVSVPTEGDYVYHATNADRLRDIADSGKLNTHKPWEFTDQDVWPDGSVNNRAYFGRSPEHLWQFAPEHGEPVIVRTAKTPDIRFEKGTGDLFTEKPISAKALEFLGVDNQWHPVPLLKSQKP